MYGLTTTRDATTTRRRGPACSRSSLQWIASHRQSHHSDVDFTRAPFPTDTSTSRRHFHLASKRLARTFPDFVRDSVGIINNGRPTLPLVVMGVPFLARQWLSRAWYQIVGSDDPRHLRAGTQVQRKSTCKALSMLRSTLRRFHAVAPVQHAGRFWGIVGRSTYILVSVSGRFDRGWDMRDCLRYSCKLGW